MPQQPPYEPLSINADEDGEEDLEGEMYRSSKHDPYAPPLVGLQPPPPAQYVQHEGRLYPVVQQLTTTTVYKTTVEGREPETETERDGWCCLACLWTVFCCDFVA